MCYEMTFDEAVEWISEGDMSLGLKRVAAAVGNFTVPPFVHVVGTNGKGSICEMLTCALVHSGKSVGTFTSPHLECVTESIRVNGVPVSEEELVFAANRVRSLNLELTSFERLLCVALSCFEVCDICVIEAGLGGALDATNALGAPLCVVLSSVSLDHCNILGNSVMDIARNKLAVADKYVFGRRVPLVYAPQEFDEVARYARGFGGVMAAPVSVAAGMRGEHQQGNAMAAATALRLLGVAEESIEFGVRSARVPGRLECVGGVYFDGCHNVSAAKAIASYFCGGVVLVFGVFRDKQYAEMIEVLSKVAVKAFCVSPPSKRALLGSYALDRFLCHGVDAEFCDYPVALESARAEGKRLGVPVCVCGSLSIISLFKELVWWD